MSELRLTPEQPTPLVLTMLSGNELKNRAEMAPLLSWLSERMKALPEMKVTKSQVTDGKDWKLKLTPDNQVQTIQNRFFSITGIDVATDALSWHQAIVSQRPDIVDTKDGKKVPISGVVVLLKDPQGKTFVSLAQEPLAPPQFRATDGKISQTKTLHAKELHPIVKSVLQTSVEKLKTISEGQNPNANYDVTLTKLLTHLEKTRGIKTKALLSDIPFSKALSDGNRIDNNVMYGALKVTKEEALGIEKILPEGRWCTSKELDALVTIGLTNGHLNIANSVVNAQQEILTPKSL